MSLSGKTARSKWAVLAVGIFMAPLLRGEQTDDIVLRAMRDELARSMSQLQLQQMEKPYFIAYRAQDITERDISAMLGSLTASRGTPVRSRLITVEVRVGDYNLDNSNFLSMERLSRNPAGFLGGLERGPVDDNYGQLRREFWLATDAQYKKALEDLSAKRAALKARNSSETLPDFSKEPPTVTNETAAGVTPDYAELEAMARELSAVFRSAPEINRSSVKIKYRTVYTRYLNSEGTSFTRTEPLIKLEATAKTQAANGLPISDSFVVYALTTAELPQREHLRARVQKLSAMILDLRAASTIDRYNGPVLFEDSAAGEIFLQQFGSRLTAGRTPVSDNPQFETMFTQVLDRLGGTSFQDKLGAKVLPGFLSVRDDPTVEKFQGTSLLGTEAVDSDGVKTRETVLVDHGILKTLLTSRVPVRGVQQSGGSRRGWGASPSNLFVTSVKTMPVGELRKELLRMAKERGLDYGLVVRRLGEGSAMSFMEMAKQLAMPGGSSQSISEVYKLYADGHEEPVRGLRISDLPAESFKEIVATGNTPSLYSDEIFPRMNNIFSMGLSSGGELPVVSCVSPSLLFEEVSLAKSEGPFPAAPVSPSPMIQK